MHSPIETTIIMIIPSHSNCHRLKSFYVASAGFEAENAFVDARSKGACCMEFFNEKGQGLFEYAMIILLVAILVLVLVAMIGPAVGDMYSNVVGAF